MPCHACQSKPGTVAAIGGTDGSSVVCFAADVPSAITLPAWMFGTAIVASENITWMLPARRSVSAAGVPLYGTCWIVEPVLGLQRLHEQVMRAAAADRA